MERDNPLADDFINRCLHEVLHCTDTSYAVELKPHVRRLFFNLLAKRCNNIRNRWRLNMLDYRKFFGSSLLLEVLLSNPLFFLVQLSRNGLTLCPPWRK